MTDEGRLQLFPNEKYISAFAYGASEEEAKSNAAAAISKSIQATVEIQAESSLSMAEQEGGYSEYRSLKKQTKISASNTIYRLQYTSTYYDAHAGMYACLAFINRDEAWDAVEPALKNTEQSFTAAYTAAMQEPDRLKRLMAIQKAQGLLESFYALYDFARFVAIQKARQYEALDTAIRQSYAETARLKNSVSIAIVITGDQEKRIYTKLAELLSVAGLTLAEAADYTLQGEITYEISQAAKTYQCYPELVITIGSANGTAVSYAKQIGKVAGFDTATVQRRVYQEIEKELDNSFIKNIF